MAASSQLGQQVDCLAPVGDGRLVAGCSTFTGRQWSGAVAVLNPSTGGALQAMVHTSAGTPAVACLPQADQFTGRRVVASGGDDGSVQLWYLSSGSSSSSDGAGNAISGPLQLAQSVTAHDGSVVSLAAGAGTTLASASADGTLRLWDCGQLLASTAQLGVPGSRGINAVAWVDVGGTQLLASAGDDGRLCLWDTRVAGSAPVVAAAVGAPALSLAAAAGSSGQLLLAGDQLGRVSAFDARTAASLSAAPLQQKQLHSDAVHALAAGAGGAASASDDGSIMLLDCSRLEASRQLAAPLREGHDTPCYMRALAWEGKQLWRGGWDQAVAPVAL